MAKTHLEHQLVRNDKPKNATAKGDVQYPNYNAEQGIRTALILGVTFVLAIIYLIVKYKWHLCKKRLCKHKTSGVGKDTERQQMTQDASQEQNIREQSVPISVQDGVVELKPVIDPPSSLHSHSPPQKNNKKGGSLHTARVDTYTLVMSETSRFETKVDKAQTSIASVLDESRQLLPPPVNQALRTAHWVNTVITNENELISEPQQTNQPDRQTDRLNSGKRVTKAEINHKEEDYAANKMSTSEKGEGELEKEECLTASVAKQQSSPSTTSISSELFEVSV
ncbi:uncharacterized protein [Watersipora subatra]|uniref:uncharacterized protein n=1 Tax=Watersipora subatra TaxID=2589382 RepID=UPI00355B4F80